MKRKTAAALASSSLFFLVFAGFAYSQPAPLIVLAESDLKDHIPYDAWVEFKDKGALDEKQRQAILAELERNSDPRTVQRRKAKRTFPGLFDERDFPLRPEYVQGVAQTGVSIGVQSRWLNGVSILGNKAQFEVIKKLPFVRMVTDFHERKPRAQVKEPLKPDANVPVESAGFYGRSRAQVSLMGLDQLHQAGFTGRDIVIAVVDCGFDLSHTAFRHAEKPIRIKAQWDFVENDADVVPRPGIDPTNYEHGTLVLGVLAGYAPEEFVGTATDAEFILCNAEDGEIEYYLEERYFAAALEFAESRGADILTTSLVLYGGYGQDKVDGQTAPMTRALNIAAGNGIICFSGCGNSGHDGDPTTSHLMTPSDGKDVIAVGAVNAAGNIAGFSSDGPTRDGRLKPEVLAMGQSAISISLSDKKGYVRVSGTSFATPIMAGAAACLLQTHPLWTVEQMREALFRSGAYFLKNGKPDPLFVQGYGIPDVFLASGLKK